MNLDEIIRRDLFRPIAGPLALILALVIVFATMVFKPSVLAAVPDREVLGTVAEKLRRAVGDTPITLPDGNEVAATISVGAGLLAHDASIDAIIAQIDTALLDAKRRGRDRVGLRA